MYTVKSLKKKQIFLICAVTLFIILVILTVISATPANTADGDVSKAVTSEVFQPTEVVETSHYIDTVSVIPQEVLKAGCETYACTMLLQSYGFDIDEYVFSEEYLITRSVYYGEDGERYGPDMFSAQAGDVYTGYGVYAPAMAKSMNLYLKTTDSKLRAKPLDGVTLEELCDEYIDNDIPVMVWATTWMMEPYVNATWIVDYVDENARTEIGDTFSWMQNEHCLVLIGYDEENYYFADSCEGDVSVFEKKLSEQRYEEIGMMAVVLQ